MAMQSIVATFSTLGEAGSARSALVAAGIDAELYDDNIVGANWLSSNAVGGIKVIVPSDDSGAALEVLTTAAIREDDLEDRELTIIDDEPAPSPVEPLEVECCPSCAGTERVRVNRMRFFLFAAAAGFGIGIAVGEPSMAVAAILAVALITAATPSHRCLGCGERWNARDDEESPVVIQCPPPQASDTVEDTCPRCGSRDVCAIHYRRLKALSLVFTMSPLVIVPIWAVLPKIKCESCGRRAWRRSYEASASGSAGGSDGRSCDETASR